MNLPLEQASISGVVDIVLSLFEKRKRDGFMEVGRLGKWLRWVVEMGRD